MAIFCSDLASEAQLIGIGSFQDFHDTLLYIAISINTWWSDSLPHLLSLFSSWPIWALPGRFSLKSDPEPTKTQSSNHSALSNHSASLKEFCSVATSTQGSICMSSSKINRWIVGHALIWLHTRFAPCVDIIFSAAIFRDSYDSSKSLQQKMNKKHLSCRLSSCMSV